MRPDYIPINMWIRQTRNSNQFLNRNRNFSATSRHIEIPSRLVDPRV